MYYRGTILVGLLALISTIPCCSQSSGSIAPSNTTVSNGTVIGPVDTGSGSTGVETQTPISTRTTRTPHGINTCQTAEQTLSVYADMCLNSILSSGSSGISIEPTDYANITYITQQCTNSCLTNVTQQINQTNTACNTTTATTVTNTYDSLGSRIDLIYRYYNVLCAQSVAGTYDVQSVYQQLNAIKQSNNVVVDGTLQSYEFVNSNGTVLGVTQYSTLSSILSGNNNTVDSGILDGSWNTLCGNNITLPTVYNIIMLNELYTAFTTYDVYDDANRIYQVCSTDPTTSSTGSILCVNELSRYFNQSGLISQSTFDRLCEPCLYRAYNNIEQWTVEYGIISGSFQYAINDMCVHSNDTLCSDIVYNVLNGIDYNSTLSGLSTCSNNTCTTSCATALNTLVPVNQLGECAATYINLLSLTTQETEPIQSTDIYTFLSTCNISINTLTSPPTDLLYLNLTLPNLDTALFDPSVLQDGGSAYLTVETALTDDIAVLTGTLPQNVVVLNLNLTTNYDTLTSTGATADVYVSTDKISQLQPLQTNILATIHSGNFILPSVQSYTVGINLLQEQVASANSTVSVVPYATYVDLLNAAVYASNNPQ